MPRRPGCSRERMLDVAEQVRAFVADRGSRRRCPTSVDGRPGFDAPAVSPPRRRARRDRGARARSRGCSRSLLAVVARGRGRSPQARSGSPRALRAGAVWCAAFVVLARGRGTARLRRALLVVPRRSSSPRVRGRSPRTPCSSRRFPSRSGPRPQRFWAGLVLLGAAAACAGREGCCGRREAEVPRSRRRGLARRMGRDNGRGFCRLSYGDEVQSPQGTRRSKRQHLPGCEAVTAIASSRR